MAQAKTLTKDQLAAVVDRVVTMSHRPLVDDVLFKLSFCAGLRACEMAGLKWRNVLNADGSIVGPKDLWEVPPGISKGGRGRHLPMHPDLHAALVAARAGLPPEAVAPNRPLIPQMLRGTGGIDPAYRHCRPNSLVQYIGRKFAAGGAVGCSSHSGRRTFITELARRANTFGCSLRDVQKLAGHSDIATTEVYVDLSERAGDLVGSL